VLSGSYNWNKTTQNNSKTKPEQFDLGLFQRFIHVKQKAETKQK